MLSEEQRAARRQGIGGSDAAAVLGLSPWKTPFALWQEKTGAVEADDETPRNAEAMRWGGILEGVIADEWSERTGKKIRRTGKLYRHPEHEFMAGYIDRLVIGESALLEVKTANLFSAQEWGQGGDEVPAHYLAQVQHYLAVTGRETAYVAALIGGADFRHYEIARDDEFIGLLIEREAAFWRMVEDGTPPPVTTLGDAALKWPSDNGEVVEASAEVAGAVAELAELKAQRSTLDGGAAALELTVKAAMGDASILVDASGKTLASWKTQTSRRVDAKLLRAQHPAIAAEVERESATRVFRLRAKA